METMDDVTEGLPAGTRSDPPREEFSTPINPPATHAGSSAYEGVGIARDTIFDRLVSGENDVVGLLAYSLSMQNKRDWLAAFQAEKGRDPDGAELAAYEIGERIERRLATYRKLAEHALAGNSFFASAALTPVSELPLGPTTSVTPAPAASSPPTASSVAFTTAPHRGGLRDAGGKVAIACGVFVILVVAAFAARQWIGV
jgi:hypothetical protein